MLHFTDIEKNAFIHHEEEINLKVSWYSFWCEEVSLADLEFVSLLLCIKMKRKNLTFDEIVEPEEQLGMILWRIVYIVYIVLNNY